jgi:uncharacterized protein
VFILQTMVVSNALKLTNILKNMDGAVVALSGGVDSAVVAKAALIALGEKAIAITADSPSVPRQDIQAAKNLAKSIGLRHEIVLTSEFDNPDYRKNAGDRCYFCKSELYETIFRKLSDLESKTICSGANLDDLGDYRPGLQAAKERGIRHPLQEAGLGKKEVRELAKHWGLEVWDKPASPCLSSRIAPGVAVTPERTARIERAEIYLKSLGLFDCRVRLHHDELVRIELLPKDIVKIADPDVRDNLTKYFHELGFRYITMDMDGFRSGSLNSLVPLEVMKKYQAKD